MRAWTRIPGGRCVASGIETRMVAPSWHHKRRTGSPAKAALSRKINSNKYLHYRDDGIRTRDPLNPI